MWERTNRTRAVRRAFSKRRGHYATIITQMIAFKVILVTIDAYMLRSNLDTWVFQGQCM